MLNIIKHGVQTRLLQAKTKAHLDVRTEAQEITEDQLAELDELEDPGDAFNDRNNAENGDCTPRRDQAPFESEQIDEFAANHEISGQQDDSFVPDTGTQTLPANYAVQNQGQSPLADEEDDGAGGFEPDEMHGDHNAENGDNYAGNDPAGPDAWEEKGEEEREREREGGYRNDSTFGQEAQQQQQLVDSQLSKRQYNPSEIDEEPISQRRRLA